MHSEFPLVFIIFSSTTKFELKPNQEPQTLLADNDAGCDGGCPATATSAVSPNFVLPDSSNLILPEIFIIKVPVPGIGWKSIDVNECCVNGNFNHVS